MTVEPEVKGTEQGKQLTGLGEVLDTSSQHPRLVGQLPIFRKFLECQGLRLTATMTSVLETDKQVWLLWSKAGTSRIFQESSTKYPL